MTASPEAIDRYRTVTRQYRTRTAAALALLWDRLGSYEESDISRYATQAAPVLDGAKRSAVALSAAFFSGATGIRVQGVRPDVVIVTPRIDHPFHAAWHAVNMGRDWSDALQVGRSQAQAVGVDFVQSVTRRTGDAVAARTGRDVRWRRVPRPDTCAWCATVSGQLYRTAESADFGHDRCSCVVVPT